MKKVNRKAESQLKSYLIDGEFINELGEIVKVDGVTTRLRCRSVIERKNKRYSPNHRVCQGRGYLNFDSGKYVYDAEGNRRVTAKWSRSCDCVNRKVDKDAELLKSLLG